MRNSSKKMPWHLRFAPGAILRPIGRIVSKAGSLASAILQPIRQRLNQWNWRKKTALVTALAITAGGVFYQNRAHAAAIAWPIVAAAASGIGTDFLVNVFASYASSRVINSKIKKTANANPDGWLYSNREYNEREYSFDDSGTKTENYGVDADANALYHKAYETSGTDTRLDPSTLEQRQVLDYVSHNTHLNGTTEEYQILNDGEPLYYWDLRRPNRRFLDTISFSWGGYVQKPTDEEIQEELDDIREDWNEYNYGTRYRQPRHVGNLTLGPKVSQVDKRFVCDKEVRLWSKFSFNRVPGDTSVGPNELTQPGKRSKYVTSFKYRAREAGYNGMVVTKVPRNQTNEEFTEYPEPLSYTDHNYLPQQLNSIIWATYKITKAPVWTGEATRFFKHKKIRNWCKICKRKHNALGRFITGRDSCRPWWRIRHEYPVYQNESVTKP